jgi:osmotically inducible lipoprotein OsmB
MRRIAALGILLGSLAMGLAACGRDPGTRAVTGGLIGAGGGAIVGGALGSPGTGALVGAGAGAITGAATAHH